MRILTSGALIVAVGTLAALPFRRYTAIPDATVPPTQATGPTESTLGGLHFDAVVNDMADDEWETLSIAPPSPPTQWPVTASKQQVPMPLTYEDLAVPLQMPPKLGEQVVVDRAKSDSDQPLSQAPPSRMSPLAAVDVAESSESQFATDSTSILVVGEADETESQDRPGPARLVSSPGSEQIADPLPKQQQPVQRHWIRQP